MLDKKRNDECTIHFRDQYSNSKNYVNNKRIQSNETMNNNNKDLEFVNVITKNTKILA